mgnify:CR=1 FL=1
MIKFYYIIIDALLSLKRNSGVTFANVTIFFIFSFLLIILGRLYLIFTKTKLENQKDLDGFDQVGALQQFINFSTIMQVLTWMGIATAVIVGVFYYSSVFTKHFLAQKDELLIMKLVGASSIYVSMTIFLETIFALAVAYLLETALIRFGYMWMADRSSDLLRVYMIQPIYFRSAVELPVFLGLVALIIGLTISIQRKIYTY